MCSIVVINRGEKEIGTPTQFLEHFGFLPKKWQDHDTLEMNCCLCQCDLEKTFLLRNIPFKEDYENFYVGDLNGIVID